MKQRTFKKSMRDYCKIILGKMKLPFRKKYRKTFHYLEPTEQNELKQWLRQVEIERLPNNMEHDEKEDLYGLSK